MTNIPIYDADSPVACTIGDDEVADRRELVERLRGAVRRVERTDHGLLLHFPAGAGHEDDVRRFAVDEKRCCGFWGFAVATTADDLTLRWDGPPATGELLDQLYAWLEGRGPRPSLAGLV